MSIYSVEATLHAFRQKRLKASSEHQKMYWRDGANTLLGAQYKAQIAYHLVRIMSAGKLHELSMAAYQEQATLSDGAVDLPSSTRGPAKEVRWGEEIRGYTQENYRTWLISMSSPAPIGGALASVTACVLRAADKLLASHLKHEAHSTASLYDLLVDFRGTVRDALEQSLELLIDPPGEGDWSHVRSEMHGIVPSGQTQSWSEELKGRYSEVLLSLRRSQSVEVAGPHYSGKHSLLRRVFSDHRARGFRTDAGSLIPMFALSLHETPAAEAIGLLASFYRRALEERPSIDGVPGWLDEISHYSRRLPALIIVAGLDAIDDNEIVRALNQDLLGEIISRIMDGHPETRLLVSRLISKSPAAGRKRRRKSGFPALDRQTLSFDERIVLGRSDDQPLGFEYRALHRAFSTLLTRAQERGDREPTASIHDQWLSEDRLATGAITPRTLHDLAVHIHRRLLDPDEASCLALIALSHDGLPASAIRAIVGALGRSEGIHSDWSFDPDQILRGLPAELVHRPRNGRHQEDDSRYTVERAFRERLLSDWRARAPAKFRAACWGMARAAVIESRRLRTRFGVHVAAARDVQVLIFLLASAEASQVTKAGDAVLVPEAVMLPPLRAQDPAMSTPDDTIAFAYSTLFERDLARLSDDDPLLGDARLRLAAAYAFIDNRKPWRSVETDDEPRRWPLHDPGTPWFTLNPRAKLRLLSFATNAAARLNLSRLVAHFGTVAQDIGDKGALTAADFVQLARIRRYALDAGILFGCDPARVMANDEAGHPGEAITLSGVEAMANDLMKGISERLRATPAGRAALSKLRARRAEILHVSGRHAKALLAFQQAGRHRLASEEAKTIVHVEPLVGRSRRMYLRLLVELARAELFDRNPAPVRYLDNLELPMLHRSTGKPVRLEQAEEVSSQSIRELTVGSISDWIGAKIDRSRLSSVQLRYADALELLTQARTNIRGPGVGRDLILELLSVHGRVLADAASFAMATAYPPKGAVIRKDYVAEVAALGHAMRVAEQPSSASSPVFASRVSFALCDEATACLETLKSLTTLGDRVSTRYVIFADYLDVWLAVVRSRQWIGDKGTQDEKRQLVKTQLVRAAERLEPVARQMMESGYLMHWREVRLLATGLAAAGAPVALPDEFPSSPRRRNRSPPGRL